MNTHRTLYRLGLTAVLCANALTAAPGDIRWNFSTGDIVYGSPAIAASGQVLFGSEDGVFYCLNPDGSEAWNFAQATDWIDASAAVGDDFVVLGSWDTFVYCLNLADGSLRWGFQTGGMLIASPVIGPDGTIYCASTDGALYALDASGNLRWGFITNDFTAIDSSPALSADGQTLFFGSDGGTFYAINTSDGAERWAFSVEATALNDLQINSSPALLSDGAVVFGSRNGLLYCLEPDSGAVRWSYAAAEGIDASPAVTAEDAILFAARDGYLYCLDANGLQRWETLVGDVFYCSPAVTAGGDVIIASYAGSTDLGAATAVAAYSITDGSTTWEQFIPGYNDSSPNVAADGTVYIGAHNGMLYAIEGTAALADTAWPRFRFDTANSGSTAVLSLPVTPLLTDWFPSLATEPTGWFQVAWFSSGWLFPDTLPYVYHLDHGAIYLAATESDSFWFFDPALGWLFANPAFPFYYFSATTNDWLQHLEGTSGQGSRWFFDFSASIPDADGDHWVVR